MAKLNNKDRRMALRRAERKGVAGKKAVRRVRQWQGNPAAFHDEIVRLPGGNPKRGY